MIEQVFRVNDLIFETEEEANDYVEQNRLPLLLRA